MKTIINKIFETPKGTGTNPQRTICEVFRDLYDLTIIHLKDKPEVLKKYVLLLEEGFIMGIKSVSILMKHRLSKDFKDNPKEEENKKTRYERIRITKELKNNTAFLKQIGKIK